LQCLNICTPYETIITAPEHLKITALETVFQRFQDSFFKLEHADSDLEFNYFLKYNSMGFASLKKNVPRIKRCFVRFFPYLERRGNRVSRLDCLCRKVYRHALSVQNGNSTWSGYKAVRDLNLPKQIIDFLLYEDENSVISKAWMESDAHLMNKIRLASRM